MAVKLLFFLLFLSISFSLLSSLSSSASVSSQTVINAAEALSNSSYFSMSLTLQSAAESIAPLVQSPRLTIFFPSDSAFSLSGQPPFSLLLLHISPSAFPLHSLKSLPPGSKIPTLLSNHSLLITSNGYSDAGTSINGVKICGSPIYDDGSVVIFGIDKFFDPGFNPKSQIQKPTGDDDGCSTTDGIYGRTGGFNYSFAEAVGVLRHSGYSVMASFLDLQLRGITGSTGLTIFAPIDRAMNDSVGDFNNYSSIFRRHVVHSKIPWLDLSGFRNGVVLPTSMEGFGIRTRRSGNNLMLNDVSVMFPDMYQNSWLVVHGVRGMLDGAERQKGGSSSLSGIGGKIEVGLLMVGLLLFLSALICT